MAARTTSTGKPRAKRNSTNKAALKAWDTALRTNPNAGEERAKKAVATRQRNIAAAIAAAKAEGKAAAEKAAKRSRKRSA